VRRLRTAVLISGRGSNMEALVAAAQAPDFPAEIALVLSNRPEAPGLAHAKSRGVATAAVDHKIFAGREQFERSMQVVLEAHGIEFICFGGFMRLLTPWFIGKWAGRMLNIHPALLPAFRGLHTHERALAEGVKIHGCTAHFVMLEMDEGPIVAQAAVPVLDGDDEATLHERIKVAERELVVDTVGRMVRYGWSVQGRRVRIGASG